MATVAQATDTREGREVALKRPLLSKASEEQRKRLMEAFEREYYTLSELAHPSIIEVYDYGIDERGPYYTMELLSGQDLASQAPVPWQQACALLRDVASSLAIVHARGLLHRDVTAANIQCTEDGRAKLIDFGAMCPMGVVAVTVGTPPFVPPEAVQRSALDGRADLFALGATMYYVLTQRHAYPAATFAQLGRVWRSRVQPPDHFRPDVPRALCDLVMALLSPAAVGRPPSAAVVFERLTGIAQLPRDEAVDVARAYLVAPSLVGRSEAQARGLKVLLRALRGRGSALLVRGGGRGRGRALLVRTGPSSRAQRGDGDRRHFGGVRHRSLGGPAGRSHSPRSQALTPRSGSRVRLGAMRESPEFQRIRSLVDAVDAPSAREVALGPGDDGAILRLDGSESLVVSCGPVRGGRSFSSRVDDVGIRSGFDRSLLR